MSDFVYNRWLMSRSAWKKHALSVAIGLSVGTILMPALIYGCGAVVLGTYEGGSLGKTYQVVLGGLAHGSITSWIVVLGPCLLWQLGCLLRTWWRASARRKNSRA
jgi:hypothetical protein